MAAAAPASAARATNVVAVDVPAVDRHEQRARPDLARVVGDAADLDGRETARADRPAVEPRAAEAARSGQPVDQAVEAGRVRGLGVGQALRDGAAGVGHRRTVAATRPVSRPAP